MTRRLDIAFFMWLVIATLLGLLANTVRAQPATQNERALVAHVLAERPDASPFEVLYLLRLEDDLGVPERARGILAAWRSQESGFAPAHDLWGDDGAALGPMQLWPAWGAFCVLGRPARGRHDWFWAFTHGGRDWRGDLAFSARCVVAAVEYLVPRMSKRCPNDDPWAVAEAAVSVPGGSCSRRSSHWRLMESWRDGG